MSASPSSSEFEHPDLGTLQQAILQQVRDRGPSKSICPSEVARSLGGHHWQQLMPSIRQAGAALVKSGDILATQQGQPVDPLTRQKALSALR
ncbi:DUF3253 domain-containing protein [Leptolyngbya sp. AN02str]|uniref:DUF3253 domain-containing protein n=1 Tax=Leptolyngbya sp. AN02str TaxID=3423363 RepID=UPI003D3208A4